MFTVFLTEYLEVYLDRKVREDHQLTAIPDENVTAIWNTTKTMLMFLLKFTEQGSNQVYRNQGIVYTTFENKLNVSSYLFTS